MRKLIVGISSLGLAASAQAGLAFGELLFNPQLQGTGQIGSDGPFYTGVLPSWVTGGGSLGSSGDNLIGNLTSPIVGVPGFSQFNGVVESWAYAIQGDRGETSGVGFVYQIRLSGTGAERLVRASIDPQGWDVLSVPDAGSDGSGDSFPMPGAVNWTDGDPYFMNRDADLGYPIWQFRLGNNGSVLNRNHSSALVWFETNATADQVTDISDITLQDGGAVGGARIISVPEPAALATLALGALLMAVRRR